MTHAAFRRVSSVQPLLREIGVDRGGGAANDAGLVEPRVRSDAGFTVNGRFLGQPVTGVQRYAREVLGALDDQLDARNQTADLLSPDAAEAGPSLKAIASRAVTPLKGVLWEQLTLPRHAKNGVLNLCNLAPLAAPRQIVCIHDLNTFLHPESYSASFRLLYRNLLPLIARRATRLSTVSTFSANMIAWRLGVPRSDIVILPNGSGHVRSWSAERSTLLDRLKPSRPFVLLIGSRAKHKNIVGFVLSMAPALDELGFDVWVAGGGASIFAELEIEDPPNLRWLGRVSDDDLAALYQSAFCLAFPSLTEGFGLPLVEAMALGCPVVASDRASMPEICGDAALLADPGDPGAWLAQFRKLAGSAGLRAEMIDRGRGQAAKFSWERTAEGYLDLLRDL